MTYVLIALLLLVIVVLTLALAYVTSIALGLSDRLDELTGDVEDARKVVSERQADLLSASKHEVLVDEPVVRKAVAAMQAAEQALTKVAEGLQPSEDAEDG